MPETIKGISKNVAKVVTDVYGDHPETGKDDPNIRIHENGRWLQPRSHGSFRWTDSSFDKHKIFF